MKSKKFKAVLAVLCAAAVCAAGAVFFAACDGGNTQDPGQQVTPGDDETTGGDNTPGGDTSGEETPATKFTVTFDTDGGTSVASQEVESGNTVSKPDDPQKAHYEFKGWYSDSARETEYVFSTPVTSNITVYAKWEYIPITNTLTYGENTLTVTEGESFTIPVPEVDSAYDFVGWFAGGEQLTDETGASLSVWAGEGDVTVVANTFPALTYEEAEGGWAVTGNDRSKGLSELVIPSYYGGKPVVAIYGFAGYEALTSVKIPATVTDFDLSTFPDCAKLASIEVYEVDGVSDPSYASQDGVLFTADMHTLVRYPAAKSGDSYEVPSTVTDIAAYAFADVVSGWPEYGYGTYAGVLKSVSLPSNLRSIGDHAFDSRNKLESVTYDGKINCTIGAYAFYCTKITSFPFGDNITSIGDYAFAGSLMVKTRFTSVSFGQNSVLKTIGANAFQNSNIESFVLPASVESIGAYAFSSSDLKTITFAEGCKLTAIPQNAFAESALTAIEIPDSVTEIASYAFYNCQSLASVKLPANLQTMGANAFHSARKLAAIEIPGSLEVIPASAFNKCSALAQVTISEGVKRIGENAFDGAAIVELYIPSSVTEIGNSAFANCDSLVKLTLNEGLQKIGNKAFYAPKQSTGQAAIATLQTVNIPASVTSFGTDIFSQYKAIEEIVTDNEAFLSYLPDCEGLSAVASVKVKDGLTLPAAFFEAFEKVAGENGYTVYTAVQKEDEGE